MDIARRTSGKWIIDFGNMDESAASLYEAPFQHVIEYVKPERDLNRRERRKKYYWQHGETVPGLRAKRADLSRFIVTARVSKHRFFVWVHLQTLPDSRLVAVMRDDDATFGILHSRFHEQWSLLLGGWHGVGNDPQYTPSLGFETFPFPEGLSPNIPSAQFAENSKALAIAAAARVLNDRREAWLNPPELVMRLPEVVTGFPDRMLAIDDNAAQVLKDRTITKLYNLRPAWLQNAHKTLDAAVADAYGWAPDISDEDALSRLLTLNLTRPAAC